MLLVASDPRFADHDPGRGHPERPARLEAVHAGIAQASRDVGGDADTLVAPLPPRSRPGGTTPRSWRCALRATTPAPRVRWGSACSTTWPSPPPRSPTAAST